MKQKAHIGTTIADKTVLIEQGLVERFVDALDIDDPRSSDPAAAKAAGLPGLMLPTVAAGSLGDHEQVVDLLELKPKQVLHSRENILLHQPVCVGEELQVTTTIQDLYEQQGGGGNPMGFVAIEVVGVGKKGVVSFEVQRVLAVRGGFPRR
jgi:acyl dehydratase